MIALIEHPTPMVDVDTTSDGWDVVFGVTFVVCLIGIVVYDLLVLRERRPKKVLR